LMGIAPVPKEKVVPPPKTCVLCTTVRGAPLKAVKMPPGEPPPNKLIYPVPRAETSARPKRQFAVPRQIGDMRVVEE
jgi:hypothetical protein